MRDGFDAETNSIYVPADWNARTGITLVPGLQLGKMLGQGMQVKQDPHLITSQMTTVMRFFVMAYIGRAGALISHITLKLPAFRNRLGTFLLRAGYISLGCQDMHIPLTKFTTQ